MKDQQKYWNTKILDWEKSIYSQQTFSKDSPIEQVASLFRGILKIRMEAAEKLIAASVRGKRVADLGCGTGIFLTKLLKYKPKQLIGVDIAPLAIKMANENTKRLKIKQAKFLCADIRKNTSFLKNVDIISGIGFIDYFNPHELGTLLKNIKGKMFLFSFPERKKTIREIMHKIYLILANCPGSYKYSKEEMNSLLAEAGFKNWWYYDEKNIRFVTNLPKK